jgi:hypothetical protein
MTPTAGSRVHGFLVASFLAMIALGAGCAAQSQYTYVPIGPGASGGPAAEYPVPPTAPQGSVYVTSFGFTDFDAGQGAGQQRLLHARLAVSNGSATPWEVDGRQQFLAAPGLEPQAPSFMNTNAGDGPVYPVAPGAANVFDLYFALPPGLGQPQNLGGFALDWNVNASGQVVANQTSFERMNGVAESYDPYPPYVVVGLGFGVGWWYSPFYPYRHYPPVIRGYYYAPRRAWGGPYRGAPPSAWRGAPPRGGWRGAPPARGGWHGAPPASGGWRGAPPASRSRSVPGPAPRGGGWRGGGGGRRH